MPISVRQAVRVGRDAGVDAADALTWQRHRPAFRPLGQFGSVAAGRSASLTCLNGDFEAQAVIVAGTLFRNEGGNGGG